MPVPPDSGCPRRGLCARRPSGTQLLRGSECRGSVCAALRKGQVSRGPEPGFAGSAAAPSAVPAPPQPGRPKNRDARRRCPGILRALRGPGPSPLQPPLPGDGARESRSSDASGVSSAELRAWTPDAGFRGLDGPRNSGGVEAELQGWRLRTREEATSPSARSCPAGRLLRGWRPQPLPLCLRPVTLTVSLAGEAKRSCPR